MVLSGQPIFYYWLHSQRFLSRVEGVHAKSIIDVGVRALDPPAPYECALGA
jgi:hypothetical protein